MTTGMLIFDDNTHACISATMRTCRKTGPRDSRKRRMRALHALPKGTVDSVTYDERLSIAGAVPGPGSSRFLGRLPSPTRSASLRPMGASLTPDGMSHASQPSDQMEAFLVCVGRNPSTTTIRKDGSAYRVQLGDVELYRLLEATGLTQRKCLSLGSFEVPAILFFNFVRGLFVGVGFISIFIISSIAALFLHYYHSLLYV